MSRSSHVPSTHILDCVSPLREKSEVEMCRLAAARGVMVTYLDDCPVGAKEFVSGASGRHVGWVVWRKDLRLWEAIIMTGASAEEASALVYEACWWDQERGRSPRLRDRAWVHSDTPDLGRHAYRAIAIMVDVPSEHVMEAVSVPDSLEGYMDLLLESFRRDWTSA